MLFAAVRNSSGTGFFAPKWSLSGSKRLRCASRDQAAVPAFMVLTARYCEQEHSRRREKRCRNDLRAFDDRPQKNLFEHSLQFRMPADKTMICLQPRAFGIVAQPIVSQVRLPVGRGDAEIKRRAKISGHFRWQFIQKYLPSRSAKSQPPAP